MFQAVIDINLQTSYGDTKNYLMTSILMTELDTLKKHLDSVINNCKRSYNNLPICKITVIVFDISNKVITHYKDIDLKEYSYNEPVMTTAKLANSETTKQDYSKLFSMYEYALIDMQKNNERR